MPKCGSTSIQNTIEQNTPALLKDHGIYYDPQHHEFNNDYHAYELVVRNAEDDLARYVDNKLERAAKNGAGRVLFSSENLFSIAEDRTQLSLFVSVLEKVNLPCTLIIVIRMLEQFMKSYILQLIANGSVSFTNLGLANWILRVFNSFHATHFDTAVISLDRCREQKELVRKFVSVITGYEVLIVDRVDNVTPKRPVLYTALEGQICKFQSLNLNTNINGYEMDHLRMALSKQFDQIYRSAEDRGERGLGELIDLLSGSLENHIDEYIRLSIDRCRGPLLDAYNQLLERHVTVRAGGSAERPS